MPSSTGTQGESNPSALVAPVELTLHDWGLRDRPVGSLIAIVLSLGASFVAGWSAGNVAVGAGVAVLLAATLWRTWLPVRYRLGARGIEQSLFGRVRTIPWSAIGRHEVRSDGVLLLPVGEAPLLAARGLYLHWAGQREAVLAQLEYWLTTRKRGPPGSSLRGGSRRER